MPWWKRYDAPNGNVYTDELNWKTDLNATKYFNELLSISPTLVDVPDGDNNGEVGQLQVFEMSSSLLRDESKSSSNLVIPPGSAALWESVCEYAIGRNAERLAVVGSPGMGKSRSSPYLMLRYVETRRGGGLSPIIIYEHRKEGKVWMFVPEDPDSTSCAYSAFRVKIDPFLNTDVAALENEKNLYIVDGDQVGNKGMPNLTAAFTIYVVSPDPEQVSEFNKHAARIRYFPAWTEADILAAAKFMTSSPLTDEEYSLLMKSLGPNPRALFPQDSSAVFPAAITLLE